jgi:predicted acyl esterase
MLSDLGEPPATFEQFIKRTPADPAWREGGLYHDDMGWGVPALWFNSWYDVSIGPNLELFNHARTANTDKEASANQYAVVAPVRIAAIRLGPKTEGRRSRHGRYQLRRRRHVFGWFDRWLKGDTKAFPDSTPHVRYFLMGANRGRSRRTMAAQERQADAPLPAQRRQGEQPERRRPPGPATRRGRRAADRYRYDPMNPVQTIGGGDCCNGGMVVPGAFDQRRWRRATTCSSIPAIR